MGFFYLFFLHLCRLKQQDTRQQYSYNEVQQYGYHNELEKHLAPVMFILKWMVYFVPSWKVKCF